VPGREAAIDFRHATDLGVTIVGDPFPHLLFEFVLSYSHWTWNEGACMRSRSKERLVRSHQC
jgi:hypothetical protein